MKRNAIIRIVLFSILAVVLTMALLGGIGKKRYHNVHRTSTTEGTASVASQDAVSYSRPANAVEKLSISWVSGQITIEAADTDTITVSEDRADSQLPMVLKQDGSKLLVECCADSSPVFFNVGNQVNKNLYITVPQNWECKELEIDAASADVTVTGITAHEVEVDTASGEYRFQDCHVDSLEMDTASGGLEFTGTLRKLDLDSASAGAKVNLSNHPKSIQIDSASGDLDLTLPEDCGFTVKLDTLSGSCSTEQDTVKRDEKLIHGDGTCKIEVDGLSSSVHIRKAA